MSSEALPEQRDELPRPVYGPYAYARSLLTSKSRVLDVGCGNGKVSAFLAESGATVDGIEPAASRASVATTRVRHLSVVPAGAEDPALLDTYDVITFFDVIEHLAEPHPVLEWAADRLGPGGQIVASIPNSAHISFRIKVMRGDWSMHDWGLFDRTHLRFYDVTTMTHLLPPGTTLVKRLYFAPEVAGWRRFLVSRWPRLFALHAVMVWRKD